MTTRKKNNTPKRQGHKVNGGSKPRQVAPPSSTLLDDILGICLIAVGIILFVAVLLPANAPVTSAISFGLKMAFGLGAYFLPFAFVVWGIVHFVRTENTNFVRLVIGLMVMCIAIMGILSLYNPDVNEKIPASVFDYTVLVTGGGYVGGALAWVLLSTFGRIIGLIILIVLILIGLILVGFSIKATIAFFKNYHDEKKQQRNRKRIASGKNEQVKIQYADDANYSDTMVRNANPQGDETIVLGPGSNYEEEFPEFMQDEREFKESASLDNQETIILNDSPRQDFENQETIVLDNDNKDSFDDSSNENFDDPSLAPTVILPKEEKKKKGNKVTKKGKNKQDFEYAKLDEERPDFDYPNFSMLKRGSKSARKTNEKENKAVAAHLQSTLEQFNLPATVVGWLSGPTVTMFKVELSSGTKLSKLTSLADDIALALAASSVRIAQIPNTSYVGVEIPNKTRSTVLLGDILSSFSSGALLKPAAQSSPKNAGPLQIAVGEDVDGNSICVDLASMPHLLIGGTTGSGKSVCINSMIMSILMRANPDEVRMILIDPKRIEFSQYNGIPHLYVPVVTEPKEAACALKWGVVEMERRLKVFQGVGARNIGMYNDMVDKGKLDSKKDGETPSKIPYIVIIIDELSDLMMAAGKEVEDSIVRISQLARAAGIHLIVATQRPSSNVVTGMIKANITNRIALLVATGIDSRVILDQTGAEKLVGNGDMLFSKPEWGKPKRIQCAFVGEKEINDVVSHLKKQGQADYHPEVLEQKLELSGGASHSGAGSVGGAADEDPLVWEAADAVVKAQSGSTSMLQRRLRVGYARAGRIMDILENLGIVGPPDGSHPREVLIKDLDELDSIRDFGNDPSDWED
ncbi:MAG: DNA translocase FtsK [Coriobacteriales bacterium]|nr:DNA translocase FtsK [Coriobacteriales bacterium]